MKKLFLALMLCFVSVIGFAQTEVPAQTTEQPATEKFVTQEELKKTITQMNNDYKQMADQSGFYLEKAGNYQTTSLCVALGGILIGGVITIVGEEVGSDGVITIGGILAGAAEITALVFQFKSASYMKKSGFVLRGNGVAYKF